MVFHSIDTSGSIMTGSTPSDSLEATDKNDDAYFQRLLSRRDAKLQLEMDRMEKEHQEELGLLRIELSHHKGERPDNFEEDEDSENEGIDLPLLPEDTFSYLAFSKWHSKAMAIALFVMFIQTITLTVLALDFFSTILPGNKMGVPISANTQTAVIQVIALFIIVFSQGDLQDSLNLLFMGYDAHELESSFGRKVSYVRWLWSLSSRLFVALYGLGITFVMIVRESEVTQLLLDFTSIEFVTNIDNVFFWLTAWGYLGLSCQKEAQLVAQAKAPQLVQEIEDDPDRRKPKRRLNVKKSSSTFTKDKSIKSESEGRYDHLTRESSELNSSRLSSFSLQEVGLIYGKTRKGRCMSRFPRFLFLVFVYFTLVVGWAVFLYWQRSGEYFCNTVYVQWDDIYYPELATFSGIFDLQCEGACVRPAYLEHGHGAWRKTAKFFYCEDEEVWVFAYSNASKFSCDDWVAKTSRVDPLTRESYDITANTDNWFLSWHQGNMVPLPHFALQCFDCKYVAAFCGEKGQCVKNKCVCDDGYYGHRCEFALPCDKIQVDPRHPNGGPRTWAGEYYRLHIENGAEITDEYAKTNSSLVIKYNRPVFKGGGNGSPLEFIIYNGRRWLNIVQQDAFDYQNDAWIQAVLTWHGYWSNYTTAFLSTPIDFNTFADTADPRALTWMEANPQEVTKNRVQGPNTQNDKIDLKLLCATCSNDTNPCLYNGFCDTAGSCSCIQGSEGGTLCQLPPSGNGQCDVDFNTPRFNYDGGDCCESTCQSTSDHECGFQNVNTSIIGATLVYTGYPNCVDLDAVKQLSGSKILYRIKERGSVICGVYESSIMNKFFTSQCEIIASSIFGNSSAHRLDFWGGQGNVNRFTALNDGTFDVIFGSDYTANRDIFEKVSKTPFSYASMPYYFAGLTFAGIPKYVQCADSLDSLSSSCQDIKICIMKSSSWYDVITQNFPPSKVVGTNGLASSILAMNEGLCNVIGGTRFDVQPESIEPFGLSSDIPYVLGNRMHTKSFETWQTTASDRQWTKFISWVFEALVQAEESGITKSTALERMAKTDVFGEDFEDIFINAVLPHGNFGELWDKTMPFPRAAMNQVCDGTSGLILSMDFGAYYDEGPRPSPSGHIEKILQRGALKCEVREAPGFGTFEEQTGLNKGLEVDICKAVAAALFKGQVKVDFVAGFKDSTFQRIQSGEIDLAMGRTRTLQREVKHSQSKGFAYDFSPPYFYDSLTFSGPMPYGRCASELVFNDTNSLGLACSNTKICVPEFSSWIEAMRGPLMVPESNMIVTLSSDESIEKHFASGECNAIAYESLKLKSKLQDTDYLQDTGYYVGTRQHTKEAISAMYLSDDSQFSDLLRWIVYGLFYAEENKITAESFMEMPLTQLFGAELAGIWQNSVKEVGNYGEIFERNLNGAIQRDGFNLLNELDGPQLCASPGTAAF